MIYQQPSPAPIPMPKIDRCEHCGLVILLGGPPMHLEACPLHNKDDCMACLSIQCSDSDTEE